MPSPCAIAIVGRGGIFPDAPTLEQFWENIRSGACAIDEVPHGRWSLPPQHAYAEKVGQVDTVYNRRGAFIRALPDLSTLPIPGLSAERLATLDPLFSLLLHAGSGAWSEGKTHSLDPSRVGVLIGNLYLPTAGASAWSRQLLGQRFAAQLGGDFPTEASDPLDRFAAGMPATLLARALGLGGGAQTLDAACASSLYAIALAVEELASGRADAMLAGGAAHPDPLYTQMGFSQLRALSPSGVSAPFDRRGDGLVVGEGAGIFLLKRLDDARRDGDTIHAVIRGYGLSNDVGGSLLAPLSDGQLRAMRAAYAMASWAPQAVDLIECHATGTPVGDAVEFQSLRSLWGDTRNTTPCVIGSVKSNIGHLLTGAGAAALHKVLCALQHETLPPTATFAEPANGIDLATSPFTVLQEAQPWQRRDEATPRRAAVSAFGFGGINAHILIEEWRDTAPASEAPLEIAPVAPCDIAIVGLDARFGPWQERDTLRRRLLGDLEEVAPSAPPASFGIESEARGYWLKTIKVSAGRFRIPPKEMEEMLPQQLLMLEVAANAMDDAALSRDGNGEAGVFIGLNLDVNSTNFTVRWDLANHLERWGDQLGVDQERRSEWLTALRDAVSPPLTANRTMGALGSIVASRIAREFACGGSSFALSAEEDSGLRALETAARALQSGRIDRALVGAVDLAGDIRALQAAAELGDAPVVGEGAAAVVLKRLEDARRDGDRVYAVVRGVASATPETGTTLPEESTTTLAAALRRACAEAGIAPQQLAALDQHGASCAPLFAELAPLTELYGKEEATPLFTSTAATLGHCGAAAGLAALVRGALALHHRLLPPLKSETELPFPSAAFSRYWLHNRSEGERLLAIGGSALDGNSSQAILAEADASSDEMPLGAPAEALFVLPGETSEEILQCVSELAALLKTEAARSLSDLAGRWYHQHGVAPKKKRAAALVPRTLAELTTQLELLSEHLRQSPQTPICDAQLPPNQRDRLFYTPDPQGKTGKVAFVFPGSGNHYPEMGRAFSARWPQVYAAQETTSSTLADQYRPDLFWSGKPREELDRDHRALIFGQVAHGTAASDLVRRFGLEPQAMVGYSLGESAGLFSLMAWRDRDLMRQRIADSTLFTSDMAGPCDAARQVWGLKESESVDWTLGVVDRPADKVRKALRNRKRVYLLIVNTPDECVIGGRRDAVEKLVAKLDCRFYPLQGVTAVHCEVAAPVAEPYRALHHLPVTPPPGVTFYSGSWGRSYEVTSDTATDTLLTGALQGVDFPKTIEAAYADGVRTFLEIGPGGSCSRMIGQILGERPHLVRPLTRAGQEPESQLLRFFAQLASERIPFHLAPLYGMEDEAKTRPQLTFKRSGAPFVVPPLPKKAAPAPQALKNHPVSSPPAAAPSAPPPPPPVTAPSAAPQTETEDGLLDALAASSAGTLRAHEAYLRFAADLNSALSQTLSLQMDLVAQLGADPATLTATLSEPDTTPTTVPAPPTTPPAAAPSRRDVAFDRDLCMEFAIGSVAKMLGPGFAEVDSYPTRVRLPDEPLMLVDRIVTVEGEPRSMSSGRVVTEHDVKADAWYLDGNRIPTCVAVEAGQADLFLSGYLGIDFITKGKAVYRLLDAEVAFHGPLPQPGDVIHYDIHIDHFFRQDQTYLFRFWFDGTVNGRPLITMRKGCAGFFTEAELAAGKGIVHTKLDLMPRPGIRPDNWCELVPMANESYDEQAIDALYAGDLSACFGPRFANLPLRRPMTLPGGKLKLVDRVTEILPGGGRFGLGQIRAEMDIQPDDWFLTCHFSDDNVMPGTLMYECCLHTLRIYLLRMGWIGASDRVVYEPVPEVSSSLKCRGQVIDTTRTVTYEVTLKEIGYRPEPYAVVDALMYADGKPIVEIGSMSVRLSGLDRQSVEALWSGAVPTSETGPLPLTTAGKKPALYTYEQILAYSQGNPSEGFGEKYRPFDTERVIARLPRPPFQFLDRITGLKGEPWKMVAGASAEAQYDVPPDAWYFGANRQSEMPFSILLETGLQPCGWLAAYVGSALTSPIDLSFRNLDGDAVQHRPVTPDSGTLTTTATLTGVSSSGGMIIQHYDFEIVDRHGPIYTGKTVFGFFSKESLANQVGIRDAKRYAPSASEKARGESFPYPDAAPFPERKMRMVDQVDLYVPDGGPAGLGYLQGSAVVDPAAWFFQAHFYQDPVWPGSLGLESFLQLLKVAAFKRWGGTPQSRFSAVVCKERQRWSYRGQIIPQNQRVTVEAVITAVDDDQRLLKGDGYLIIDGRVIYEMHDFTVKMEQVG